jgi:lysyl-tRNA synthetase, class II
MNKENGQSTEKNTSAVEYQVKNRTSKIKAIRAVGQNPFATSSKFDYNLGQVKDLFLEGSVLPDGQTFLVGRIKTVRMSGKIAFYVLEDESLPDGFQAILKKDILPEISSRLSFSFEDIKELLDEGDYVQLFGKLELSQRGEPSIMVSNVTILTKSLRPLPNELEYDNTEERYTNRVVDFKMNTKDENGFSVRDIVRAKQLYWNIWRDEMNKAGFTGVECPIFEHIPGGAEAKPFTSHYNELEQDMYLRISLELPLKKLIAGGFESVYEIGRVFRNESSSPQHLQEYTMIEWYKAYTDYNWAAKFVKGVYQRQVKEILGSEIQTDYYGNNINWGEWCSQEEASKNGWDLEGGWPKIPFFSAVRYFSNGEIDIENKSAQELVDMCTAREIHDVSIKSGMATLLDKLWKKARVNTINPFFLILPPVELEPLAKRDEVNTNLTQRWQIVAGRAELGKAFTELNDPIDQFGRFEEQQKARDNGNEEAQFMDPEYIKAMELGMPPMSGFGTSERFVSFLLGKHIKECSVFPYTKRIEQEVKTRTMVAHCLVFNEQEKWSFANTLTHLGASFASRQGLELVGLESSTSKEEGGKKVVIKTNIKNAIVNYETSSQEVLHGLYLEAQKEAQPKEMEIAIFTKNMRDNHNDEKIELEHSKILFKDIEILGILIYGKKSEVEELTASYLNDSSVDKI